MNLWQKYLGNRLTKIQSGAKTQYVLDEATGLQTLKQDRFKDLRYFISEDLQQVRFGLLDGLKYMHTMNTLCATYQAAIVADRAIQGFRNEQYFREVLAPLMAEHEYILLESPLSGMAASFCGPHDIIVSFPKGEYGIHQCERLLAALKGEEVPVYDTKKIRKRVNELDKKIRAEWQDVMTA